MKPNMKAVEGPIKTTVLSNRLIYMFSDAGTGEGSAFRRDKRIGGPGRK